ncbi:MAG: hypothetical protein ACR2RL_11525, partial [Gammaproteobacteria bacterium]
MFEQAPSVSPFVPGVQMVTLATTSNRFRLLVAASLTMAFFTCVDAADLGSGVTQFDAGELRLEDVRADVEVIVESRKGIEVRLSADTGGHASFAANVEDNALTLTENRGVRTSVGDVSVISLTAGDGSSKSYVTIDGQTVVSKGSGVVVLGSTSASGHPRLEISVPAGTAVTLANHRGEATIGDLHAPLIVETSGTVHAGDVTWSELRIRRNGEVKLNSVAERLELFVTGNGSATVAGGEVARFEARVEK